MRVYSLCVRNVLLLLLLLLTSHLLGALWWKEVHGHATRVRWRCRSSTRGWEGDGMLHTWQRWGPNPGGHLRSVRGSGQSRATRWTPNTRGLHWGENWHWGSGYLPVALLKSNIDFGKSSRLLPLLLFGKIYGAPLSLSWQSFSPGQHVCADELYICLCVFINCC